jgi:DNA-binding GntR family transcriptional regulator
VTEKDKALSNTQRAAQQLRTLIFEGALGPGTDHLETELATRLGMSRTPVREAALTLQAQGLVEMRPRKGMRVLALSAKDMGEIYDVLTELEGLSAQKAAGMGYRAKDLAALARAIDRMDKAVKAEDREAWALADDAFHAELVRLGGNARAIALVGMMVDQVRRAKALTLYMRPLPTKSNDDHRSVLEAIARGDADAARRIHHTHRAHAKDMLLDLLKRYRLALL